MTESTKKKKVKLPAMSDIEKIERKENLALQEKYNIEDKSDLNALRNAYLLLRLKNGSITEE